MQLDRDTEAAIRLKPNLVILDYTMPVRNGAEATREICKQLSRTEVLIFTLHDSQEIIEDILTAARAAYLLKSDANDHLIAAVRALARHEAYISNRVSADLFRHAAGGAVLGQGCSLDPARAEGGAADRRGAVEPRCRRPAWR